MTIGKIEINKNVTWLIKIIYKGEKIGKMIFDNKKWTEFSVIVYKKDLNIDLNRLLISSSQSGIKEIFYVPHTDTAEEHFHIYVRFEKQVTKNDVESLFFKTKCYISPIRSQETALSLLNYYTEGFRLPFETNYSLKCDEIKKHNSK